MPQPLTPETLNRIQAAVTRGDMIPAIKIYREATGEGLAEAKAFVESMRGSPRQPTSADGTPHSEGSLDGEVEQSIYAGNRIAAIRRYREVHPGMGLAQAKQEVEALFQKLRSLHPERITGSPRPTIGCGGTALAAVLIALVALGAMVWRNHFH